MFKIYCIITNSGDGSNSLLWTDTKAILDEMEKLADKGYESFASGDGLQVTEFKFKTYEALADFVELNQIDFEDMESLEGYTW